MAESDESDVEFQSADEGDNENIEEPNTSEAKCNVEAKIGQSVEDNKKSNEEFTKNANMELVQTIEANAEVQVPESEPNNSDTKEEINVEKNTNDNNYPPSEKQTTSKEIESKHARESRRGEVESSEKANNTMDNTMSDNEACQNFSDPPDEQVIGRHVEETSQVDVNPAAGDADRSNIQKNPLDKLSEKSTSGGWGWGGWGKSLISSATSTVSGLGQGLSSAIQSVESSLGVPQPEEIAQKEASEPSKSNDNEDDNQQSSVKQVENDQSKDDAEQTEQEDKEMTIAIEEPSAGYSFISYGASALTGVVGKTVSGGLGALELIGKKTMDVIQDGDPGLRRKRDYFTKRNMPSLSQTLKEAAEAAEEAALKEEEDEERNRAHFGVLFDKFQGLSHLEALEILSNQSEGKVHSVMATVTGDKLDNLKTQMIEIKDAFQLQDMDTEEEDYETATFVDTITEHLFTLSVAATPDKLKKVQKQAHEWLARCKKELETKNEKKQTEKEVNESVSKEENKANDDQANDEKDTRDEREGNKHGEQNEPVKEDIQISEETTKLKEYLVPKEIHVKAIQTLAELTSRCIEQFHKAAELMLLQQAKEHSKNPIQRAASLSKLTSILCCEVNGLTSSFCELLTVAAEVMEVQEDEVNPFITNSYLEGSNSMSYIQDAYQLLLPVLQVVAIECE